MSTESIPIYDSRWKRSMTAARQRSGRWSRAPSTCLSVRVSVAVMSRWATESGFPVISAATGHAGWSWTGNRWTFFRDFRPSASGNLVESHSFSYC